MQGGENIEKVLKMCLIRGIKHVSMWALSKENITSRDASEIAVIYELIRTKLPKLITLMQEQSIRFATIGDLSLLPDDIRLIFSDAVEATKHSQVMTFILAF